MAIRKISEFVAVSSPQNSDKLLIERNGSGKSITVENLLNDVATRTRVNLLRPSLVTTTNNGVTCTNNNDGTYTVSGKATSDVWLALGSLYLPKGAYRLVGNKADSGTHLKLHNSDWSSQCTDLGGGANIETNGDTYELSVYISSGSSVVGNVLIKPMITNDLSATYDDFVSYNDSFITGINSGIKLDLLWTNASPYSDFPEQTISLDLGKYKVIAISVNDYGTDTSRRNITQTTFVLKNVDSHIFSTYLHQGVGAMRNVSASDDGIYISWAIDSDGSYNAATAIPQKIWGIM